MVRALDDPDLGRRLVNKLRTGLRDLLGAWRLEYLSICENDDLENALDRFPVQPLEAQHFEEPQPLLAALFTRMGRLSQRPARPRESGGLSACFN